MRAGMCLCSVPSWLTPRLRFAATWAEGLVCVANARARTTDAAACHNGDDTFTCRLLKANRRLASVRKTFETLEDSLFEAAY